jgi:hypothetical protein
MRHFGACGSSLHQYHLLFVNSFKPNQTLIRSIIPGALIAFGTLLINLLAPNPSHGCACGCGVFEVGDLSMFPQGQGGVISGEWDFQNQNHNWSGSSRANATDNDDKNILTHFTSIDLQYFFNSSWGVELQVPWDFRTFITTADSGKLVSLRWNSLGDIRLNAWYTGFTKDQSIGLSAGLKLPTGDWKHNDAAGDIDRDSELGTGSTDLLIGAYIHHHLTSDNHWRYFAQVDLDQPMFSQDGYCPGTEIDAAAGIYYNNWYVGHAQIRPIAQVLNSYRTSDSGPAAAQPVASGYERVLLSPALEVDLHPFMLNASVAFPVYQYMTGDQLVAHVLLKVDVSYKF